MISTRVAAAAAMVSFVVAGCSTSVAQTAGSADYPTYTSVEQLAAEADAVLIGAIGDELGRQTEGGDDGGVGNPMVFYEVKASRVFKGGKAPDGVVLGYIDLSKLALEGVSPVKKGQQLLLFLRCLPDASTPEITVVGDFCIPLSADNGVFDVSGDRASARSLIVRTARAEGAASAAKGRFEASVMELEKVPGM